MFDDLDISIRAVMHDIMLVLYEHGVTEVHTGAIMRLLGVSDKVAQQHDNERIVLDDSFVKYVEEVNTPRPPDQPLH